MDRPGPFIDESRNKRMRRHTFFGRLGFALLFTDMFGMVPIILLLSWTFIITDWQFIKLAIAASVGLILAVILIRADTGDEMTMDEFLINPACMDNHVNELYLSPNGNIWLIYIPINGCKTEVWNLYDPACPNRPSEDAFREAWRTGRWL